MQNNAELTITQSRILFNGCPLCASDKIRAFAVAEDCSSHPLYHPALPKEINWMCCEDCAHVFTDGYFDPEAFERVLSKTHDNQFPGADWERQRYASAKIVEKVTSYLLLNQRSWLDVGFGNGSLMFTAEEYGFKVAGLDLRRSSVDKMCELGFEVYCQGLVSYSDSTNRRFSVISMADVLEHTPYPKGVLEAAYNVLEPHGVLFVSMPNYNCAAWRLLDQTGNNPYWIELEHYHNFSRARLFALLREMKFEPIHYGISERYRVCMEVIARK